MCIFLHLLAPRLYIFPANNKTSVVDHKYILIKKGSLVRPFNFTSISTVKCILRIKYGKNKVLSLLMYFLFVW